MAHPQGSPDNTDKILSQRLPAHGRTTLTITYTAAQAQELRRVVQSIRIKGGKTPTMAVFARRAMALYLGRLNAAQRSNPQILQEEVEELERLVTPVPQPARR